MVGRRQPAQRRELRPALGGAAHDRGDGPARRPRRPAARGDRRHGGRVTHDPEVLPADLPVPEDDGAADHLPGAEVPPVDLVGTGGVTVDLAERSRVGTVVVFAYPRTGRPDVDSPAGWDQIPGARGCTPEACSFRDLSAEFAAAGAELFGLSTQDHEYQSEAA